MAIDTEGATTVLEEMEHWVLAAATRTT